MNIRAWMCSIGAIDGNVQTTNVSIVMIARGKMAEFCTWMRIRKLNFQSPLWNDNNSMLFPLFYFEHMCLRVYAAFIEWNIYTYANLVHIFTAHVI